jgi:hypothetical protein
MVLGESEHRTWMTWVNNIIAHGWCLGESEHAHGWYQ